MLTSKNTHCHPQVICLPKALDAKHHAQVWGDLKPAIRHESPQVLLDMSHIYSLDWQGLTLLMDALVALRKVGGKLALMKVNPAVKVFLELTRVNSLIPAFDDEVRALNWFME